ncbi:deoxyribose-phosphate aldolase [Mediannikoviicoccus vaginalis]|uniref:deoxyribose-phosphate aldolase n=1 Tax=Mediannikoviicoccus vaginalis TaxID=2899727 RepID=UPI001F01AD3C|nr:deoxyribose-phosphate aldolase [Mediannikoviicoccus vaginalis]
MKLNKYIDHTILKADAKKEDVVRYCKEAREYDFMSVCVNSCHVKTVKKELEGSDVKVCCVVGFPLGAMATEAKSFETKHCVENGADEVDMVINIGALKDKNYDYVKSDIEEVVKAANGKVVKVIIETCLLDEDEKKKACEIAKEAKAHFVKTSTGFSTGGAKVEDIRLMKSVVGEELKVKASGGVRTKEDAVNMIDAGASRIGASSGINIVK